MPSDETRRLLKVFGIAVTTYEDALQNGAASESAKKAEAEVFSRLEEVKNYLEQLRAGVKAAN